MALGSKKKIKISTPDDGDTADTSSSAAQEETENLDEEREEPLQANPLERDADFSKPLVSSMRRVDFITDRVVWALGGLY